MGINIKDDHNMFIVNTKVHIKKGKLNEVLQLFRESNPKLVRQEADWLKAYFTANEEKNSARVPAFWINPESCRKFSASEKFKSTMADFARYFKSPRVIEINRILFEM